MTHKSSNKSTRTKRGGRTTLRKREAAGARPTQRRTRTPGSRAAGLPPSLRHAKWIESPDQHAERPGETLVTRSHEVIQEWAEERGGRPATAGRKSTSDPVRALRIDFPGYRDLEPIDWDEWFGVFDDRDLLFVFQEHKADGSPSNFFRLDNPAQ